MRLKWIFFSLLFVYFELSIFFFIRFDLFLFQIEIRK